MLYINPETCIDCNLCVPTCPVEAIFADLEVPQRYQPWTKTNADEGKNYPTIAKKIDPLPTAITLDEWKQRDAKGQG
jgi:ferredoxin